MEDPDEALWELANDLSNSVECCFCPTEVDREDSKACCTCGRVVCGDCAREIFTEIYCKDCGVCKICHNEAVYACDKCGKMTCPEHVHERIYREFDTNFEDVYLLCDVCLDKGN